MEVIALPKWIPQELWDGYIEMRKKIKKPATDFAQTLVMRELYKLRGLGHDPVASLEQSIVKCWTDVYPSKDKALTAASSNDYAKNQDALKASELTTRGLTKPELAENARKARERIQVMKQARLVQ